MATAKKIRELLISCAKDAGKFEIKDISLRARCFAAIAAGALSAHGEDDLANALRAMLELDDQDHKPTNGA